MANPLTHIYTACAQPPSQPPQRPVIAMAEQIPAIAALIDTVRSTLSEDNQHHLKPKTEDDLHDLIANGSLVFVMLDDKEAPIAVTIANLSDHPSKAYLQSVCVHPDHQKKGLMNRLLDHIESWAAHHNITGLLAKVACSNSGSQDLFHRQGYTPLFRAHDLAGGYAYNILSKRPTRPLALAPAVALNGDHDDTLAPSRAFALR